MSQKSSLKNLSIKELAAIVSKALTDHGIDSILVGGSCVSKIDFDEIQRWSKKEGHLQEYNTFLKAVKKIRK